MSMITNRALPVLGNKCILVDKFNRQYDPEFGQKGRKIGATANVRVPPRYLGTFGAALNVEPSTENYYPVSILYQYHVDIQFNTINMLLDIDEFEPRFIRPACKAVANRWDSDGAYFAYQNTANRGGTPGTAPVSYLAFANARAILVSEGMMGLDEVDPVYCVHPLAMASMADSLKGLLNPQARISGFFETGMVMKLTAGGDWFEDPNIASYTTGTLTGTPVLAGVTTAAGGSAIITSGWGQTGFFNIQGLTNTAAQCTVGDTLQIGVAGTSGLFPVNPQNRGRYGNSLKQFVVLPPAGYAQMVGSAAPGGPQFNPATLTAGTFNAATGQYTSSGTGTLSVLVGEPAITGGQFQNCAGVGFTGTPPVIINGGAAVNTNSTEHILFHRDAIAMALVDLPLPRTAVEAAMAYDEDLGLSMRMVTQYTINNDAEPTRIDTAYGYASLFRNVAYRVSG
jgi:hypothetical protein